MPNETERESRAVAVRAYVPHPVRGPGPAEAPAPARRLTEVDAAGRFLRRRLAAFTLDVLLLCALIFTAAAGLAEVTRPAVRFDAAAAPAVDEVVFDERVMRVGAALGIAIGCGYFCLSWLLLHATPGQRLLGLEVHDRDGGSLTPARALARWVALGAPLWIAASTVPGALGVTAGVALVGWFVGLLVTTVQSSRGDGLHDRLSGTHVVRAPASHPAGSGRIIDVR